MALNICRSILTLLLFATPIMAEQIHVQISHTPEIGSPETLAADYLAKLVSERSQGRVLFNQRNYNSSDARLKALTAGQLQFAFIDLSLLAQQSSQLQLLELPFLFSNRQHLNKVINGAIGQQILVTAKWKKIKPLYIWNTSFRQLLADRPLTTAERLNGLSITAPKSQILKRYYQLLGATPLTGGDDLQENGEVNGWDIKLADLVKAKHQRFSELTMTNHSVAGSLLFVEKNFWSQLPNDLKIIIRGAIEDAASYAQELSKQQEQQLRSELKTKGITIHQLSSAQRKRWQNQLQKRYPELMQGLNQQIIEQIFKG